MGLGVGIATLIGHAAWITFFDVTGVLASVSALTLGLLILPARRRKAKKELEEKLTELRQTLVSSLTEQFEREMKRGTQRIEDTVAPFTRFVRAEQDKLGSQHAQLVELEAHILGLRAQLQAEGVTSP